MILHFNVLVSVHCFLIFSLNCLLIRKFLTIIFNFICHLTSTIFYIHILAHVLIFIDFTLHFLRIKCFHFNIWVKIIFFLKKTSFNFNIFAHNLIIRIYYLFCLKSDLLIRIRKNLLHYLALFMFGIFSKFMFFHNWGILLNTHSSS